MAESLSGIVDRVTFHNPESGFVVLRVQATGLRGFVTVVGVSATVVAGEYVDAVGEWVHDREHGQQFKAEEIRTTPPQTLAGIVKFLGSGLVKGIGPHFAQRIVDVFGMRTLEVIDQSPHFLTEIKGIGQKRIQRIRASWQQQKSVRDILVFLQSHGLGTARAVRIYKQYGEQAVDLVRANPYRLATDVWGFGFQSADELAEKLGMDRHSPQRAKAAVRYVLQQLCQQGHVGFPELSVLDKTCELTAIPATIIQQAIETGRLEGELVREVQARSADDTQTDPWLYLKPMFLAELGVSRVLRQLQQGRHPLPVVQADSEIARVEARMKLQLADSQKEALRQALTQKVLVITGGPGVGKTTLVRGILDLFLAQNLRCALCAPTGRAAKRLTETTGREAKTIHRLLEFDGSNGGFKRTREMPLEVDLLVVDEASMVDIVLMNQLVRAVPASACLVLVGDVDQLPSVGPGTVLADVIRSGVIAVVRLKEIFRQAGQSWIVRAAHQVNRGELPEPAPPHKGDFYFIEADTPESVLSYLVTLVRDRIPQRFQLDPFREIQVLCPMNRSELGTAQLNVKLQEVLNPPREQLEVKRFGWTFRIGDKVLQTVNNYDKDVFNGDLGRVQEIDHADQMLVVNFEGKHVEYEFGELDELTLAYALSIHRSQGSEYPAVIVPLHTQHYMMLQRNLLYTGITRGKKLVVVVGSRKALSIAVQRRDTAQRCTGLWWRLEQSESANEPEHA